MSTRRFFRFVFSFLTAAALLTGAAACSSGGGEDGGDDITVDAPGAINDTSKADTNDEDGGNGEGDAAEEPNETGGSEGGNVTATYRPARGTASIDDIDDACDWISTAEVEAIVGSSGLEADGLGLPGMDVTCDYSSDNGQVWVQVVYKLVEPGLDLTEELSSDIPTIEWVESLDDLGEQAVVLEGPMGSAQVDIVDGDLWVKSNVLIGGDAAAAQQAAMDIALLGIRAD